MDFLKEWYRTLIFKTTVATMLGEITKNLFTLRYCSEIGQAELTADYLVSKLWYGTSYSGRDTGADSKPSGFDGKIW